jgi:hypothetical protein
LNVLFKLSSRLRIRFWQQSYEANVSPLTDIVQ